MQAKISAQYKNEIDMAKAQRDYELKKAAYDIEINTKKAESEMAYQLQVRQFVGRFIFFLAVICLLECLHHFNGLLFVIVLGGKDQAAN